MEDWDDDDGQLDRQQNSQREYSRSMDPHPENNGSTMTPDPHNRQAGWASLNQPAYFNSASQ